MSYFPFWTLYVPAWPHIQLYPLQPPQQMPEAAPNTSQVPSPSMPEEPRETFSNGGTRSGRCPKKASRHLTAKKKPIKKVILS